MAPEQIDDPVFGLLEWNAKVRWYEGEIEISPGRSVRVTFANDVGVEFSRVFSTAHKQFEPLRSKLPQIFDQVRREYLELYNGSWASAVNGYGQPVNRGRITASEFDALVHLVEVGFQYGVVVDLWYSDDDELFGGHSILVQLNANLDIRSTGLEG